jgi:hypothetical protein
MDEFGRRLGLSANGLSLENVGSKIGFIKMTVINGLIIVKTLICKIPPNLPLPLMPFGKSRGEI